MQSVCLVKYALSIVVVKLQSASLLGAPIGDITNVDNAVKTKQDDLLGSVWYARSSNGFYAFFL
jgi:hypothetical protein